MEPLKRQNVTFELVESITLAPLQRYNVQTNTPAYQLMTYHEYLWIWNIFLQKAVLYLNP